MNRRRVSLCIFVVGLGRFKLVFCVFFLWFIEFGCQYKCSRVPVVSYPNILVTRHFLYSAFLKTVSVTYIGLPRVKVRIRVSVSVRI